MAVLDYRASLVGLARARLLIMSLNLDPLQRAHVQHQSPGDRLSSLTTVNGKSLSSSHPPLVAFSDPIHLY